MGEKGEELYEKTADQQNNSKRAHPSLFSFGLLKAVEMNDIL